MSDITIVPPDYIVKHIKTKNIVSLDKHGDYVCDIETEYIPIVKGEWVAQKGGGFRCSECNHYALDEVDGRFIHVAFKSNFCPYCGARMKGTDDGQV